MRIFATLSYYIPRRCPSCDRIRFDVARRRQSTMYFDDEMNFVTECPECFERTEEYWRDRWDEYYQGIM